MKLVTKRLLFGSALVFGLASTSVVGQHGGHDQGHGEQEHGKNVAMPTELPKCPIMDEPINFAVSVATDEGPVFFCCKDCITKYQSNPAKYADRVATQRKALADRPKIQVTCPVSKEPVNPEVFIEAEGRKVYFCCKDCINMYQSDPAKYASTLANSYTYQTQCPVMKEEISARSFATARNGMKIYFCCKGCDKKFFAAPAKYLPNLAAQGYSFDPKQVESKKAAGE